MSEKDWTWVLEQPCGECGFDARSLDRSQLAARIRAVGGQWRSLLDRGASITAPDPTGDRTWSVLEYGCHVRDVFDLFEDRLRKMLKKRKPPTFKNWDPDEAAAKGGYAEQDPGKVAYALASNAGKVADVLDRVDDDEWGRQGHRSDGKSFTIESMARYLLHDVEHHLWDADQILTG